MLATVGIGSTGTAYAADKELLDILLANGAINQEQYGRLLEKDKLLAADVNEVVTKLDRGGLRLTSTDGQFAIKIGTRLHAEASAHRGNLAPGSDANDGSELRRARFETAGKFAGNWNWAAEVDFADNDANVKDFWLGYTTKNGTKLSFGHQKQPYSLVIEMSSNDIPFIERSVDNFLLLPFVDRAVGFRAERAGRKWFAAAGIFGEAVSPGAGSDEGWGMSGRFVYSPIIEDDQVLHLGIRASLRAPSTDVDSFQIKDETTHLSNLAIVDSGQITAVDRVSLTGLEAAYALGAFSVAGEYTLLASERDGQPNLDFDGWNIFSTWSLTGESRASAYRIDAGEFKRLTPASEFDMDNGSWGAWELALRYANINLNDGLFVGGEESVLTSALNWYPNTNVRFMLEWSRILDTDSSTPLRDTADGLDIFQFRTQYTF